MSAFENRHVVVTGGTGALGATVVKGLLEAGAHCHIPCWQESELDGFAFTEHAEVSITTPVDLTSAQQTEDFYAALPSLWASIHVAGGFDMAPIADTSYEAYRRLGAMNADSCFLCCREAVKTMRRHGTTGGRLINVAARPALEPRTGAHMVAYTMSKAAVSALTMALAEELAGEGIWVNAVAPSILDTPANRSAMPDADHQAWPKTDEVAESIIFLASPRNGSSRGGVLPVYGRS